MPPGKEEQLSDVDLDQKIAERSRAIALNQNDAKAYRDRGLLLARKREYDLALSDLNKALLLNRNDAHAFGLRGLVWEKKNDSKCALADLEKAIQLDPTNAAIYHSHRENMPINGRWISLRKKWQKLKAVPPPLPACANGYSISRQSKDLSKSLKNCLTTWQAGLT